MKLQSVTIEKTLEGETLLKRNQKVSKFESKYKVAPIKEIKSLSQAMEDLADSISDTYPMNQDELVLAELKRRMRGEALLLEKTLSGDLYDFESVLNLYAIPSEDIKGLKPWLEANRQLALTSIDRLFFSREFESYELDLDTNIPSISRQAVEFASAHIQKYHAIIGKMLQNQSKVGEFLRDIKTVPTTQSRSYFNPLTNTLAIGIPAICYSTEDGILHIREKDLITLYGHEGMGHALNYLLSSSDDLPYFLTDSSLTTKPTLESVAQHFESVLIEDLKKSPDIQKKLGIHHKFDEIYQEAKDSELLEMYQRRLFSYVISVAGDKKIGDPKDPIVVEKKAKLIEDVALDPSYPNQMIQQFRHAFDSEGNLDMRVVKELIYAAQPVQRALRSFDYANIPYLGEGRDLIDDTLLRGIWSPIGFVDNARLRIQEYQNSNPKV